MELTDMALSATLLLLLQIPPKMRVSIPKCNVLISKLKTRSCPQWAALARPPKTKCGAKPNDTTHYFFALLQIGAALMDPAAAEYAPLSRTASEEDDADADVAAAAPDEEEEEEERAKTTTSWPLFFLRSAWEDPDESLVASCCCCFSVFLLDF